MKALYNIIKQNFPLAKEAIENTLKAVTPEIQVLLIKDLSEIQKIQKRTYIAPQKIDISFNKMFYYRPPLMSNFQVMKSSFNHVAKKNFSTSVSNESNFSSKVPIEMLNYYLFSSIFCDELRLKNFLESFLIGNEKVLPDGTKIEKLEYLENEYLQDEIAEDPNILVFNLQITTNNTNNGIYFIKIRKNISQEYFKIMEWYNAVSSLNQKLIKDPTDILYAYKYIPVITISVINDTLFPPEVPCVSYHINTELKSRKQISYGFSYVFIELGKINDLETLENISLDQKDWLSFLKIQNLDHKYQNDQVNSAAKYVQDLILNLNDVCKKFLVAELENQKEIKTAKQKGIAQSKIEIAKNLKINGYVPILISKYTGLSIEEINKLS